ncbi:MULTISPECIES: hypothetical protein [Mycobacterium]|uniref:hypothetical protein n=1 Tax=Mycobacterium TaxID=1763 RepID=UPI0002AC1ADE|nr:MULTISPECIES: hypothetical protein [Mycobacterium]ELR85686.1 hypothetical protein W7U_10720 [Mycobacterium sp. H4Y]
MTDNTATEIAVIVDGEPMISATGLSLLLGVPVDEITAHRQANGTTHLPAEWLKAGRRRRGEAASHTGKNEMVAALWYWARKDHNARLEVIDDIYVMVKEEANA